MQRREGPDRPPFRRSYGGPSGGGGYRGGGGRDRDGGFRRPSYGGPPGPAVDYKALVEYVARSVADKPSEVDVISIDRGRGTVAIKVKMADEDMGRQEGTVIRVGQVVGAFGIAGAVKVRSLTDFPDRFASGSELTMDGVGHRVEWSRQQATGLVV